MPSFKAFADFQKKAQDLGAAPPAASAEAAAAPGAAGAAGKAKAPPAATATSSSKGDAAKDTKADSLRIGVKVKVCGLQARPELNDLVGTLVDFDNAKGRWKVELDNGKGHKLFKAANLEQTISDADAADILKGRSQGPAVGQAKAPRKDGSAPMGAMPPGGAAGPVENGPVGGTGPTYDKALDSRGPPAAAAAAGEVSPAKPKGGGNAAGVPAAAPAGAADDHEDEEAFVRSIEQCLKESDVMWDDY